MTGFEGRRYGPGSLSVTPDRVAAYVEATGDDPDRWVEHAPPGLASAALFVVAPDLLSELAGRSVVHGEQTFTWHESLPIGTDLEVTGSVTRYRERGGVVYVGFDLSADGRSGEVLTGTSLFLLSGESAPLESGDVVIEPAPQDTGSPAPGQRSASRATLIRYAAATGDWNPVHWDHDSAVAAGFPGVVVHGLLQAAWALQEAARHRPGPAPVSSARFRFRAPLLPAHPVTVRGDLDDDVVAVSIADEDQEYLNARIELSHG